MLKLSLNTIKNFASKPQNLLLVMGFALLIVTTTYLSFTRLANRTEPQPLASSTPASPEQTNLSVLISKLPYSSDTFSLSYDSYTQTFIVVPKTSDLEKAKLNVENFFAQHQLKTAQVKVEWAPVPGSLPNRRPIN